MHRRQRATSRQVPAGANFLSAAVDKVKQKPGPPLCRQSFAFSLEGKPKGQLVEQLSPGGPARAPEKVRPVPGPTFSFGLGSVSSGITLPGKQNRSAGGEGLFSGIEG